MYKILAPLEPVSRRTSQPGYQPGWLEDKPILREGVLTPGVVEEGCAVLPAVRSMSICSAINATESEPVRRGEREPPVVMEIENPAPFNWQRKSVGGRGREDENPI